MLKYAEAYPGQREFVRECAIRIIAADEKGGNRYPPKCYEYFADGLLMGNDEARRRRLFLIKHEWDGSIG